MTARPGPGRALIWGHVAVLVTILAGALWVFLAGHQTDRPYDASAVLEQRLTSDMLTGAMLLLAIVFAGGIVVARRRGRREAMFGVDVLAMVALLGLLARMDGVLLAVGLAGLSTITGAAVLIAFLLSDPSIDA